MADDLTDEDREALERLELEVIKATHPKATHPVGGKVLTNPELIEFMETPRTLFNGVELVDEKPPAARGPRPKRVTRYHLLAERMRGHYHRLIRLPRCGAGAKAEKVLTDVEFVIEGLGLIDLPEHKRVDTVRVALDLCDRTHDDKAIREALRTLGLYQGKITPD